MGSLLSDIVAAFRRLPLGKCLPGVRPRFNVEQLEPRQLLDALPGSAPPMDAVLQVGNMAPGFSLPYVNQPGSYNLALDPSRVKVLNFFMTNLGPSANTLPQIQSVYDWVQINGYSATVLGIDEGEAPGVVATYLLMQGLSLPSVTDAVRTLALTYDVQNVPVTYVISGGQIQYVHSGYSDTLDTDLENEIDTILGTPGISISDVTVTEGTGVDVPAAFDVTLSNPSANTVTVDYTTVDGTALDTLDYRGRTGRLTFAPGETSKTVTVQVIGDKIPEPYPEKFAMVLSNPVNAQLDDDTGIGTIVDDDAPPPPAVIYISNFAGNEPPVTGQFDVVVSVAKPVPIDSTVEYATSDGIGPNGAQAGVDYTAASGTVLIPANAKSVTVPITILQTPSDDRDKTFRVTLANPVNGTIMTGAGQATVTIHDDHRSIGVEGTSVVEGNTGFTDATFKVTLDLPAPFPVSVDYYSINSSAVAGLDFKGAHGTVTFAAGKTEVDVVVQVIGDTEAEPDEMFFLKLRNPVNAAIGTSQAACTILDDGDTAPAAPAVSVADASVQEGDTGTRMMDFTVTLSSPQPQPVTVDFTTADAVGSSAPAVAGEDYTTTTGGIIFMPGETSKTISVPIIGDDVNEADEQFLVQLSNPVHATIARAQAKGTALDNDPISISGSDFVVTEGSSGTSQMRFTISMNRVSERPITVAYATADSTAMAGVDYQGVSGTLTFAAGTMSQDIVVFVIADTTPEPDKAFNLGLSKPSIGTVATPWLVGAIMDDDRTPIVKLTLGKSRIKTGQYKPGISFGTVWKGGDEPTRTFRVANVGSDLLRVGGVVVPSGFKLVKPLKGEIPVGGSDTFTIKMVTRWVHHYSGQVRFATNQMGNKPFRFGIVGEVITPGAKTKRVRSSRAAASAVSAPVGAKAPAAGLFAADSKKAIRRGDGVF